MTTNEQVIPLAPFEHIIAVVPEQARGPGWTNDPLWVYIENLQTGNLSHFCIQPDKQNAAMRALFRTLATAHEEMLSMVKARVMRQE